MYISMWLRDIQLHLNVFMAHSNFIDSLKDNTGLLLCKKKKKK